MTSFHSLPRLASLLLPPKKADVVSRLLNKTQVSKKGPLPWPPEISESRLLTLFWTVEKKESKGVRLSFREASFLGRRPGGRSRMPWEAGESRDGLLGSG